MSINQLIKDNKEKPWLKLQCYDLDIDNNLDVDDNATIKGNIVVNNDVVLPTLPAGTGNDIVKWDSANKTLFYETSTGLGTSIATGTFTIDNTVPSLSLNIGFDVRYIKVDYQRGAANVGLNISSSGWATDSTSFCIGVDASQQIETSNTNIIDLADSYAGSTNAVYADITSLGSTVNITVSTFVGTGSFDFTYVAFG